MKMLGWSRNSDLFKVLSRHSHGMTGRTTRPLIWIVVPLKDWNLVLREYKSEHVGNEVTRAVNSVFENLYFGVRSADPDLF